MSEALKCLLLNAEDLFVLLDSEPHKPVEDLTEKEWQALSISTIRNKPLRKLREIAQLILDKETDLALLVEVGGEESLANFNRHFLDSRYIPALMEGNSNRAIDVGFLIRKELLLKWDLRSNKDHKIHLIYEHEQTSLKTGYENLVPKRFARFSRDVAELHLCRHDGDSPELVFFLTHLKSKRPGDPIDPRGTDRRSAEMRALLEIYKARRKELGSDVPILVCGDFNGQAGRENTEADFLPIYEQTDLEDLLEMFQVPEYERVTFHTRAGRRMRGVQLDYVFLSRKFRDRVAAPPMIDRYRAPSGRPLPVPERPSDKLHLPSDHYPYLFEVRVYPVSEPEI